jgi:YidC/Oxa1 family membrane protein insertase
MENKNVLIALLLMLAVWTGYTMFFVKPSPAPLQPEQVAVENKPIKDNRTVGEKRETKTEPALLPRTVSSIEPRDITVETDDFVAVFSNVGGRLKSLELKRYKKTLTKNSSLVSLVGHDLSTFGTKGGGDIPLGVDTLFKTSAPSDGLVLQGDEQQNLHFIAVLENGLVVEKSYNIKGRGYDLDLNVRITNQGNSDLRGAFSLMLVEPWSEDRDVSRYSFVGPAVYDDGDLITYKVKDLEEGNIEHGRSVAWTAFEDKYFMTAIVPIGAKHDAIVIEKTGDIIKNIVESGSINLAAKQSVSLKYLLYAGPRDLEILQQVNYDLDKAIDFGFFDMLARPLLSVLKFCYNNLVKNYGIAIILLTVFIKILFWPLTHKSYKSMRDMQKLQPEMQRLREKYKTDKERMNREIMELYRNNRVNPMGGCLPMFVQIPVFFALYKVLLGSIALRHEPFMFWIQDLSAKDPYYITPVIMGISMFIQQKMSPTTMDSQQAKIMLFMPIIFTFMFLNFPSGLVIYWLVNNILTIVQQWFINRGGLETAKGA